MRSSFLKLLFLFVFILSSQISMAQKDTSLPQQVWPELEVYYRINERFRLYSLISGTKSNSSYKDGTLGLFMDFFAKPWIRGKKNNTDLGQSSTGYYWWFRMGYSYSVAPPNAKKRDVNTLVTETNNAYNLPGNIIVQTRNRLDWRWVNGLFQPIYRPRLKLVKNLKSEYLTFNVYTWSEYFFYLNDNAQNRFRICLGIQIKVFKFMTYESYFMHQFANAPLIPALNAVGIQLDFYFKSKHYK